MKTKVKLRLLAEHYIDGQRKRPGTVVILDRWSADQLISRRRAVEIEQKGKAKA